MTLAGFLFMSISILIVLSLAGFCYWKILSKPDTPEMHAPLDIDTGDLENGDDN